MSSNAEEKIDNTLANVRVDFLEKELTEAIKGLNESIVMMTLRIDSVDDKVDEFLKIQANIELLDTRLSSEIKRVEDVTQRAHIRLDESYTEYKELKVQFDLLKNEVNNMHDTTQRDWESRLAAELTKVYRTIKSDNRFYFKLTMTAMGVLIAVGGGLMMTIYSGQTKLLEYLIEVMKS